MQIPKQNLIFWNLWQNIYNLSFLVSKLAIHLITQWWRVETLHLFNEIAAEEYNFVWCWDNMTRFEFMTILIQIQMFVFLVRWRLVSKKIIWTLKGIMPIAYKNRQKLGHVCILYLVQESRKSLKKQSKFCTSLFVKFCLLFLISREE